MIVADESGWVGLSGLGASIGVKCLGPAEYAWPARMRLQAGDISTERDCYLEGVEAFCDELARLHSTLAGRARLTSMEDDARVEVTAARLGAVDVEAFVSNGFGGSFEFILNVKFQIDQSYLPSLVRGLRAEFLNRAPQ